MFDRVLIAVDGSEHAHKVVDHVIEVAAHWPSEVRVLNVHEILWATPVKTDREMTESEAEFEQSSEVLSDVLARFEQAGVTASGTVRHARSGHIASEIVKEAADWDASAIALGTRGHTDLEGLFTGSVCHRVLHLAKVPALVV